MILDWRYIGHGHKPTLVVGLGFMLRRSGADAAEVVVTPPTTPGEEWTLPANRPHWTLPVNRMHWTLPANRMHWTLPSENDV